MRYPSIAKSIKDFEEIITYLTYDESSPTCLRWAKSPTRNIKIGDIAGNIQRTTCKIHFRSKRFMVYDIVYFIHTNQIPDKIKFADKNKTNFSFSNLIDIGDKDKNKKPSILISNKMKQPPITPDTNYKWQLNKNMINLLDENGQIVRKFKNQYVQDEDFVTNIRIELVLRFGINPKNLKEA